MRLLIQRVSRASVRVESEVIASIGYGLLVLQGICAADTPATCEELAAKLLKLRIFEDEDSKLNLDVQQTGGSILVVSQFTLYADTRKGNRPSFNTAAPALIAEPMYRYFVERLQQTLGASFVAEGRFGAMMEVELVNDGPVTIWIDSDTTSQLKESGR